MITKETCEYRIDVPWFNDYENHTGYKKHPDPCIVCNAREQGRKEEKERILAIIKKFTHASEIGPDGRVWGKVELSVVRHLLETI